MRQQKRKEAEANENATVSTDNSNQDNNEPYVLAVTACPTGIAHTVKVICTSIQNYKSKYCLTVKSFVSINYFRFQYKYYMIFNFATEPMSA